MAEFDISSIPTSATITDATMTWKVDANGLDSTDRIAIYVMDTQGTTLTSFTGLYQGITSGILVDDTVEIVGTGDKTFSVYAKTTPITPASTTGVINEGVQNPDLSFTSSSLPDNSDNFSIGSWVKLEQGYDKHDENQDSCCGNSMSNSQFQKIGMKIEAGHSLIGKSVNKIGFNLNNHQNPDGTFYARIYDSDQSTVLYTFGSISASSIASQSMQYFENTATSYTIEEDDYIVADLSLIHI